jgi:hypothetical protein
MNAGANSINSAGPISWIIGTGIIPQLILGLCVSTLLYITMMSLEALYKSYKAVSGTRIVLLPCIAGAQDRPIEFEQNPNVEGHRTLPFSDNERTGIEFSYAFFIYINPASFERQEDGLIHVMHKGYSTPYPLMSPGVFLKSNTNTMRVYMNSSRTWNNYIDVENIPVKKWVHVTILARSNALEIYINGNLAKKMNIKNEILYQNFGNLYVFSQRRLVLNPSSVKSLKDEFLRVFGTFSGSISDLNYFSYGLSYTEIQSLVDKGPNLNACNLSSADNPPYLEDNWWVTNYSR